MDGMKMPDFCGRCTNKTRCEYDAGWREECYFGNTGVPVLFSPETKKDYANYCETCTGAGCMECAIGSDGVPVHYEFSLKGADRAELRRQILESAITCVCTDRNLQYGEPEDSFAVISKLWEVYMAAKCVGKEREVCILPEDVCNLMVLFKVGRGATAMEQKKDTYVDMAGYAACAGGMID